MSSSRREVAIGGGDERAAMLLVRHQAGGITDVAVELVVEVHQETGVGQFLR